MDLNRRDIFEYCLTQKMANLKECILKEHESQRAGDSANDWPAEEAFAADFISAVERLKIISFKENEK